MISQLGYLNSIYFLASPYLLQDGANNISNGRTIKNRNLGNDENITLKNRIDEQVLLPGYYYLL